MDIQTIKIVPTIITPRQVNTAKGLSTVYDIQTTSGQNYSCWEDEYVKTLVPNVEVEVQYYISQKGQYTNYNLVAPGSRTAKEALVSDQLKKIWDKIDVNHNAVMTKLHEIAGTEPATPSAPNPADIQPASPTPPIPTVTPETPINPDDIPF